MANVVSSQKASTSQIFHFLSSSFATFLLSINLYLPKTAVLNNEMIYLIDLETEELGELYDRCVDLAEEKKVEFVPLYHMWRDKPHHYWRDICRNKKGKMIPYMKDLNGDQRSAIHGNIEGIFWLRFRSKTEKAPTFFLLWR